MRVDLFRKTDFVAIGPRDCMLVDGAVVAAKEFNLPYTLYDRKTFLTKYP